LYIGMAIKLKLKQTESGDLTKLWQYTNDDKKDCRNQMERHFTNTVEYIVICFIISHFPLLLLCIVPWSWCGWMDVHFIDWWSFDYEVTCQSFDQSQGFLHEMKHII
jgi:hypothetical protein